MKRSKGFTLIELLAVIVILAIIALIVTPVVSGIITSARNSANARSVEGHIRNVELAIVTDAFATGAGDLAIYDRTNGVLPSGLTIPENDKITCKKYTISNGQVVEATKCANKSDTANWHKTYKYTATNGAEADGELGDTEFKGTFVAAQTGETHKGIIYMDPTNIKTVCNADSDLNVTSRTTKSGCMKFYIFDDSNDTYKMILDRNTRATVAWNSTGSNLEMKEIATALASDTANWVGTARLISESEIRSITNNTTNDLYYFGSNSSTYYLGQTDEQKEIHRSFHWLIDYTKNCVYYSGCKAENNSTEGYWTSSKRSSNNTEVWFVNNTGVLNNGNASNSSFGLRPVLEISKSLIEE